MMIKMQATTAHCLFVELEKGTNDAVAGVHKHWYCVKDV